MARVSTGGDELTATEELFTQNATALSAASAGQFFRKTSQTAVEHATPSAGSIGGSTGSTDNAILRANGIGGGTIQSTGVVIDDSDNLLFPAEAAINFDSGDVTITHSAGNLTFAGAATYKFDNANVIPNQDAGGSLGQSNTGWSDLFLAANAVINFDNGDVTLTHTANALTLEGGDLTVPNLIVQTITGETNQELTIAADSEGITMTGEYLSVETTGSSTFEAGDWTLTATDGMTAEYGAEGGMAFSKTGNADTYGFLNFDNISTSNKTFTFPNATGNVVLDSATQTLTNKTIGVSQLSGQVALGNGGTGANLSDPGADRIMFWDDSAGAVDWLIVGSGLTITDKTITASGSPSFIGARVIQTGATALTTSWVACAFGAENFDTDSMHDNSTQNTRLTFTTAGKYHVGGAISIAANVAAGARILLNGTTVLATQRQGNSGVGEAPSVDTIYDFAQNDYVELQGYANATNTSGDANTSFWAYKIG